MKVGDKVLFTFLGQEMKGEIIARVNKDKWKVKCTSGTVYPFIYGKEPTPVKKKKGEASVTVLGYIIKILSK